MGALVGAATYYTATVIVKVLVAATGKGKRGRNRADLNYDALGQAAFGRPGQLLSGGVQIAELSLAAVAILCLLGDNLAQLSGGALDVTRGVLLASGVSYLLCVTRPDLLAYFSLLSLAVVLLQVALLLYFGGPSPAAAPVSPLSSTVFSTGVAGTMAAVSKAMFCFGGHSMLPSQYAAMAAPAEAPRMLRLVFGTMLAINASIGALGYALYGAEVLPKFVDNFPPSGLTTLIRAAMAYNLQSTVPLVISAIASYAQPASGGAGSGPSWLYAALVKGALLAAFASTAVFLGDGFDLVVTVGGASVVSAVSVGLPLAANLKLFRAAIGSAELAANVLLLGAAALFAVWGTHSGLQEVGLL